MYSEYMRVKVMRDVTHNGIRAILKSTLNPAKVVNSYGVIICSIMICILCVQMFLILYKIVNHIHGVTPKGICMQRPRKKGPKIIISIALSG